VNRSRAAAAIFGVAALAAAPAVCAPASARPLALPQNKTESARPSQGSSATKKTSPTKRSSTKRRTTRRRRPRGQQAPNAERIKEIQEALIREGHYQGTPTGKWDAPTAAAMKSFQEANGLKPTGKLDALSLQKLGLGSEVAGVAPPSPVAESADSPPAHQ
jgi:peptidoglycan hydrolase-like protein with peptidoglycan-binding domain